MKERLLYLDAIRGLANTRLWWGYPYQGSTRRNLTRFSRENISMLPIINAS
jgi:hypothetical protein